MPFATLDEQSTPVPVLAQVDKKLFEICVPFKYRRTGETTWTEVPDNDDHKRTDLASVPGFLLWLVPRYGAHTLAALLHDQLVHGNRSQADTIFRDALGELNVPLIRRWFMWAAVSLATIFDSGIFGKIRVLGWGVLMAGAATTFWQQTFARLGEWEGWSWAIFGNGRWWDLLIVTLASVVFVPRVGLGLVAGAGVMFIYVATLFVLATLGVYLALEWIVRALSAGLRQGTSPRSDGHQSRRDGKAGRSANSAGLSGVGRPRAKAAPSGVTQVVSSSSAVLTRGGTWRKIG